MNADKRESDPCGFGKWEFGDMITDFPRKTFPTNPRLASIRVHSRFPSPYLTVLPHIAKILVDINMKRANISVYILRQATMPGVKITHEIMKKSVKSTKNIRAATTTSFAGMAIIATALTTSVSHGALILYEGFDYASGTAISGANGGKGWGGAWAKTGGGTAVVEAQDILVPSAAAAGTGGQANLTSNGAGGTNIIERTLATTIGNNATETYWFSIRFRRDDATNGNSSENSIFLRLRNSSDQDVVSIGQTSTEQQTIALGGTTAVTGSEFIDIGQDYFALVRLRLNPTGTSDTLGVNFYKDTDSLPTAEPTSFTLSQSFDNSRTISKLAVTSAVNAETLHLDEIRMGTTFADVIPEPSSSALVGLSLSLVLLRRRRA